MTRHYALPSSEDVLGIGIESHELGSSGIFKSIWPAQWSSGLSFRLSDYLLVIFTRRYMPTKHFSTEDNFCIQISFNYLSKRLVSKSNTFFVKCWVECSLLFFVNYNFYRIFHPVNNEYKQYIIMFILLCL